MNIPKTKEQKHFEQFAPILIQIVSELPHEERQRVIDYAINLYNKGGNKNE